MRKYAYVTTPVALLSLALGCASSGSSTNFATDFSSVGVRFVVPPSPESTTTNLASTGNSYADATGYSGFVPVADLNDGGTSHVALWGGGFNGQDVTFASTALEPGMYTFAYLNPDSQSAIQGWLDVNPGGTEILDFLMRWRDNIPKMREAMAFEMELAGGTTTYNSFFFDGFTKQLGAFERLERQLNQAITREQQAQAAANMQYNELLRNAEVLLLPSPTGFFHPTTRPAVSEAELASVQSGTPISKMIMLTDADTMKWKLNRINDVYNELNRCKIVLTEEANRLQRRKRFYTLTDHIYHHDKLFVHNELRMQQTNSAIDQLNEQIRELRERRMAIAFMSELVAPNGSFQALDNEEADLGREKVVLQARLNQINQLFNEAPENSDKRVVLEQNRQEALHAIEMVETRVDTLAKARVALGNMNNATNVIHRQGNWRLMTTSFVDADIPYTIRRAIEEESLMTFRLEPSKTMFVPSTTRTTMMPPLFAPDFTTFTFHNPNGEVQLVSEHSYNGTTMVNTADVGPIGCRGCFESGCKNCPRNNRVSAWNAFWHSFCTNCSSANVSTTPPTMNTAPEVNAVPVSDTFNDSTTNTYEKSNTKTNNGKTNCNIPFPVKLLVPPCWFEGGNN